MDSLAWRHLDWKTIPYNEVCGKGAGQICFDQVDVARATEYSAEDSDVTLRLHETLYPQVAADAKLAHIYGAIEMPVREILFRMERDGVLVDADLLRAQSRTLGERVLALEQQAYQLAGGPFNLGSPKQLGEILFERMKLPVARKTATGQPSTDEEVLQELAADHPLPKVLLEHRAFSKLKSTYTDKLPQMVNARTGRVHTTFAQATAVTGRLASADPNLQNIPVRTEEGRRIREAFVAPPAHAIVSADYSQIELRIMAHLSGDDALVRAFEAGEDIHRATAGEIFGVPPKDVTADQRRYIKAVNFGLIYGMGAFGLAQQLGIERGAAQQFIEKYFQRYPGRRSVHAAHARVRARARLRRDGVRPAPVAHRHQGRRRPAARGGGARRDQRADAGHGGRPRQAGDDRGRRMDRPRAAGDPAGAPGARRARARGAGRRGRAREGGASRADDRRGDASRAARRRRGHRPELGTGTLAPWRKGPANAVRRRRRDVHQAHRRARERGALGVRAEPSTAACRSSSASTARKPTALARRARREAPPTMALTIVDPGYSTARSRGGLHAPEAGGAMRPALALLANARHVAFLSEVNRYAPNHLDALKRAIGERAWAWTQRWFEDARTGQVICRDDWESAGPGAGTFAKSEGGFVAVDALMVDKLACAAALPALAAADAQGRGEDRRFFQALRAMPHGATGEPTVYASIHVANQHPFMLAQFRERGIMLDRYMTMTPELEREVAHALQAQRDYERRRQEQAVVRRRRVRRRSAAATRADRAATLTRRTSRASSRTSSRRATGPSTSQPSPSGIDATIARPMKIRP